MKKLLGIVVLGLTIITSPTLALELICTNDKDKTSIFKVKKKDNNIWCIERLEGEDACKYISEESKSLRLFYYIKAGEFESATHNTKGFEWGELAEINRYTGDFEWILYSKFENQQRTSEKITGKCNKGKKLF